MSRAIIDGGPAFPVPSPDFDLFMPDSVEEMERLASGMSLRDYFAAKAMQAYLALDAELSWPLAVHADSAYKVADAMLKARERQP